MFTEINFRMLTNTQIMSIEIKQTSSMNALRIQIRTQRCRIFVKKTSECENG